MTGQDSARRVKVSLRYQVEGGEEHSLDFEGLDLDDLVHVTSSLRARVCDGGPARLSTEAALAQVRKVHLFMTETAVEAAVVQALQDEGARWARRIPQSVVDRIVVLVMARVGHIRGEWMVELHDCHSRLAHLQQRLHLHRRPVAELTAAASESPS